MDICTCSNFNADCCAILALLYYVEQSSGFPTTRHSSATKEGTLQLSIPPTITQINSFFSEVNPPLGGRAIHKGRMRWSTLLLACAVLVFSIGYLLLAASHRVTTSGHVVLAGLHRRLGRCPSVLAAAALVFELALHLLGRP